MMGRHIRSVSFRLLAMAALAAVVAGCSGGSDELQAYIDEVKARPGGRIEPLPEIRPAPSFVYERGDRRSPFEPDTPQQRASADPNAIQGPDPNRPREHLESYPLDTFRMVGTLSGNGQESGLVKAADGLVYRVYVGNHMGQNYGRITSITESEIDLVEIIPDGLGGFLERPASVSLSE
jgi:type IV pilus assembly protein PilP